MYAIVKINGSQYRVSPGDTLTVSKLQGNVGDSVSATTLLVADGDQVKVGKDATNISVAAKIVSHGKGEKIHIRRFRAKSKHRRHIGFRSQLTTIAIETIGNAKKEAKAETKTEISSEKSTTTVKKTRTKKTVKDTSANNV